jgi:preprotein translocase subunit SecD
MLEQSSLQLAQLQKEKESNGKEANPRRLSSSSVISTEKSSKEEKIILEAMANRINQFGSENARLKAEREETQKKIADLEKSVKAKKLLLTEIVSQIYQKQGPSLQETLDLFDKNELLILKSYQSKSLGEMQDLLEVSLPFVCFAHF